MSGDTLALIIVGAILTAVLLDLWVLRGLRQILHRRGLGQKDSAPGVFIFGAYSPTLTWLRYRSLGPQAGKNVTRLQSEITPAAPEIPVPAPSNEAALTGEDIPAPSRETITEKPTWRSALLEIAVIVIAVLLFCSGFMDFGKPTELPGIESGIFQSLDWVLYNSIHIDHKFPLWNPYLRTGVPYVADPMMHAFNPVASLPVLIFGVRDGFKLAVLLSFVLGALGMWWLGAALGMSRPARVWGALMFAFAGQPAARFFQGQYLFVLGFAWIPWTVASLFQAAQTRRRRYIAMAVFALALSFFSGNAYYSFYLFFTAILFSLAMLPHFQRRKPFVKLDLKLLGTLGITGVLALGVVAVQLLPLLEFWPRLDKSMEIAGAHTFQQIFQDYTSKDPYRPDAFSVLPAREEYYAYIGLAPFVALILLPVAVWKRPRRPLVFFLLLALFVVLWIDMDLTPWYSTFIQTKILLQFRHLLRILIFGSFAVIILAALGLDSAWRVLESLVNLNGGRLSSKLRSGAAYAGLAVLSVLMLWGISEVYKTNRPYLLTSPANQKLAAAARWLRQYDLTDTYMRANPNNMGQVEILAARLRFIEVWYHFGETRSLEGNISNRLLNPAPHYILQSMSEAPPDQDGGQLVGQSEGYNIYRMTKSLPYAFIIQNTALRTGNPSQAVGIDEVAAFTSYSPGPNRVEVIASGAGDETLVVLTMHYPGWQVRVDDRPAKLENANGFLAVQAPAGTHRYEFTYRPWTFYSGLLLSLLCSGITLYLLISDLSVERRAFRAWLRALPGRVSRLRPNFGHEFYKDRWVLETTYNAGGLPTPAGLELSEASQVRLTVDALPGAMSAPRSALRRWLWASADLLGALARTVTLPAALFAGALLVYTITRFWALERFPIYFFGDEAVQTLFGEDLITRHFHGLDGSLLPMYVEAAGQRWTPLISMYFHALTLTLFGKSIFVARATSAAVSLLGAAAVGLILKRDF